MKFNLTKSNLSFTIFIVLFFVLTSASRSAGEPQREKSARPDAAPVAHNAYGSGLNKDQVADFNQNFYWFYKYGGINSMIDISELKMDLITDLFANIDTTNWADPSDTGLVFYYAVYPNLHGSSSFTYLMTNAYYNQAAETMVPLGLYDHSTHTYNSNTYLLLLPDAGTLKITGKGSYNCDYVSNVYMNQFTTIDRVKIDSLRDHPRLCYFDRSAFHHFYTDNKAALNASGVKKIMVTHGALDKGLLMLDGIGLSNCKVQTPILTFKVDSGLLLSNESNFTSPFMNHALDVGQMCPPGHCNCE